MNSFIIEKIQPVDKKKIALTVSVDGKVEVFEVTFHERRGVSLSEGLDLLLMHKDFDYHKQFGKILSDYKNGKSLKLPIELFKKTIQQKEFLAA